MLNCETASKRKSEITSILLLKTILALGFCLGWGAITVYAQKHEAPCARLKYEDKNQVTPNSITLKTASGRVFDRTAKGDSQPVSSVCIGLFEETTKRLIATATANDDGWFKFKRVPNGKYRLVVTDMYHIFCPANIPMEINVRSGPKKKIAVYMVARKLDQCSYGEIM
jgi:hypothetical protein